MYSKRVVDYFNNPINMGIIEKADAVGKIKNEECCDIIKFYLKIEKEIISDVKFESNGCPPAIASSCAVTVLLLNKSISEAKDINENDILNHLDGLPKEKEHCAKLAIRAKNNTINDYTSRI